MPQAKYFTHKISFFPHLPKQKGSARSKMRNDRRGGLRPRCARRISARFRAFRCYLRPGNGNCKKFRKNFSVGQNLGKGRSSNCTKATRAPKTTPVSDICLCFSGVRHRDDKYPLIYKEENDAKTRPKRRVFVIFLSEFFDNFLTGRLAGKNRKIGGEKFVRF